MLVAARPAFFIAMGAKAFAALTCYPLTRLKVMGTTQRKVCAALAHTITCLEEVQSRHCRQCHARTLGPAFSPGLSRQAVGCPLNGELTLTCAGGGWQDPILMGDGEGPLAGRENVHYTAFDACGITF